MTTSELIDLADYCAETYCNVCKHYKVNCWGTFDLIEKLRNRLDKAYGDIEKDCYSCKHYNADEFCKYFTECVYDDKDPTIWSKGDRK